VPRLERRAPWIASALERVGFMSGGELRSLGVTGHTGSGKTMFAHDVEKVLATAGRRVVVLALEDFQKPETSAQDLTSTAFAPSARPLEHLGHAYDVERLRSGVLEPHARGERVQLEVGGRAIVIEETDVLVLQGPFLLHPELRKVLDRVVYLEASDTVCLRRIAGRDARSSGPESLLRARRSSLPAQRGFDKIVPPSESADVVLDGDNALGPA
jgi:uridine kinase